LWQALGYPMPSGVFDPDFAAEPTGHGFDWRVIEQKGVTSATLDAGRGFRIRLSGHQPESAELLRQVVAGMIPGQPYTQKWEAQSEGLPTQSGLEWRIGGVSADLTSGQLAFTPEMEHAVLVLAYRRPQGETRAEGSVDLRRITFSPK